MDMLAVAWTLRQHLGLDRSVHLANLLPRLGIAPPVVWIDPHGSLGFTFLYNPWFDRYGNKCPVQYLPPLGIATDLTGQLSPQRSTKDYDGNEIKKGLARVSLSLSGCEVAEPLGSACSVYQGIQVHSANQQNGYRRQHTTRNGRVFRGSSGGKTKNFPFV